MIWWNQAVALIGNQAQSECSGNVTKERLLEIAGIGVDSFLLGQLLIVHQFLIFQWKI